MKKISFKKAILIVGFITFLSGCSNSSNTKSSSDKVSFFKDGDKVCFVGNSITHMGGFHNNLTLFHVTRFPNQFIQIFNKGVSGDVAQGVLDRMGNDILAENPTHVVVMLGMNDVQGNLYEPTPTTNQDTLRRREEAIKLYKTNYDSIVRVLLSKNIDVILERPSIYDETAKLPENNLLGLNDALGKCALFIDTLSEKYHLPTIDYYSIMNRINAEMQEKDSSATVTRFDRVHPEATGHFIMMYEFLKSENAPKYVSKIIINSNNKSSDKSANCEVKNILNKKNSVAFSVKENALPFPTREDQKEGLLLVPFMDEFNVELLQVNGLVVYEEYQLKIDNEIIGSFTGKELDEGINLAEYSNTPQYIQSEKVLKVLQELWKIEGKLRGLKFIEYLPFYKDIRNKHDFKEVETFIDSVFITDGYDDPYYKSELNKFIKNKPKEEEYKKECDLLRKKAYKVAILVEHNFILEK